MTARLSVPADVRPLPGEAVLDGLPAALCVTDGQGRLLHANPPARALAGAACETIATLVEPRGAERLAAELGRSPIIRQVSLHGSECRVRVSHWRGGLIFSLASTSATPGWENSAERLAAIVEHSDDAILTKDLDGIITTWNRGAERLFGYTAAEALGQPVTMLIPVDRLEEEPSILARLRRGETIAHFETVRRRKDGRLVDISLSISPLRGPDGTILGASKIARDITEKRRAEDYQQLLLREMQHRVKNLFSLVSGVVSLCARFATDVQDMATGIQARLRALAQANELTLPAPGQRRAHVPVRLHALIRAAFAAYEHGLASNRLSLIGDDPLIGASSVTALALLVHEFVTNAAKYGALSLPHGQVIIEGQIEGDWFGLAWRELGGPPVLGPPPHEGFGSFLAQATVEGQLAGTLSREWRAEGLRLHLRLPRDRLLG